MARYIIRLDDACETMNHFNWNRMGELLDKYDVKPLVGVIPQNRDKDFSWEKDDQFWEKVSDWKNKGWDISLHGLTHEMHRIVSGTVLFQKSHGINTEFAGVPYEKQIEMLNQGMEILKSHKITPCSFFAPAHTFDNYTIEALKTIHDIRFVSDGYALKAYRKNGMIFLPSICDGPFNLPFGIYTFVFHPSKMNDDSFERLENFLKKNKTKIITATEALNKVSKKQGLIGQLMESIIYFLRGLRN